MVLMTGFWSQTDIRSRPSGIITIPFMAVLVGVRRRFSTYSELLQEAAPEPEREVASAISVSGLAA